MTYRQVEFYQESTGYVGFFLALLLTKIANERLKILTSLLFDLQTSTSALAKTTLWKVFGRKVGSVLKYSGNSLLDRHQNFFIWPTRRWEDWDQRWQTYPKKSWKNWRKFFCMELILQDFLIFISLVGIPHDIQNVDFIV